MIRDALCIATFNVALNRAGPGDLVRELEGPGSAQLRAVIDVIRHLDADVLVLNELDHDPEHRALGLLRERWLAPAGCPYPHAFTAPVNTGLLSGRDLTKETAADATADTPFGFGAFPGQYGMAVLSRLSFVVDACRTFQRFRWRDLPQARLPHSPDGQPFFDAGDLDILRLSSKSHWDLTLDDGAGGFHLLVSHPTPPAFDGPERRNACRNHDEIRFWADYIAGADYPVDDQGRGGGLDGDDAPFILAGDLNADPDRGDSLGAIGRLLSHPGIQALAPTSPGAGAAFPDDPLPATQTAHWGLRADYLLPSHHWRVIDTGVCWPDATSPLAHAVATASDHRAVWVRVESR